MSRKILSRFFLLVPFVLGMLMTSLAGNVQASRSVEPSKLAVADCYSLDVIFLIDQSGSMSGHLSARPSDPEEQRRYAVEAAVNQLTDIALDTCPDTSHRVAVVSYGSGVRTDVEFENINPQNLDDALYIRDKINSALMADNMGYTNPRAAFEQAEKLFNSIGSGTGDRKRVIIYVTDGVPNMEGWPEGEWDPYTKRLKNYINETFNFDPTLLALENCFAEVRDRYPNLEEAPVEVVNACIDSNKVDAEAFQNSTYLYTIIFETPTAFPSILLDIYEELSVSHGGELFNLTDGNTAQVSSTMREILSRLSGVRAGLVSCGAFAVNPYLKVAKLNIYKNDEENVISLSYTDAAGNVHKIAGGMEIAGENGFQLFEPYYSFGINERYVFANPYPGVWELNADYCEGLDAYYEQVEFQSGDYQLPLPFEIATYDREPYYDAKKPIYLEYPMKDISGNIIQQYDHPFFAVNVQVDVEDPSGKVTNYPMVWDPAGSDGGKFISSNPLQLPVPGTYKVNIVGTVMTYEGEPSIKGTTALTELFTVPRELFRHEGLEFNTFPVEIFSFDILEPQNDSIDRPVHGTILDGLPLPVNPLSIRVRMNPPSNVAVNDVFVNSSEPFQATLNTPDSAITITLQPDPVNPGEYYGELSHGDLSDIDAVGSYLWTVSLDENSFDVHFRPDTYEKVVSFSREDGFFNRVQSYTILLGILIAIIVAIILYNILIRTDKISGVLEFQSLVGNATIAEFSLNSGKNWATINRRQLEDYPQLDLVKVRVSYASRASKKQLSDGQNQVGFDLDDGSSLQRDVKVEFTLKQSGVHSQETLSPDTPVGYSDDSVAQVVYKKQ